jgi:adenosylcobyric acid synthase
VTATGLMVCGTGSDSGKSTIVAGLCRLLARRGIKVAPFKAQNMALNSAVTASGHEIGRAQAAQAHAAGVEPEVAMNPILLKPTDQHCSQVVVNGRPWATLAAADYQEAKKELWPIVIDALDGLRGRFDVVICEGAGSPAEINLLDQDIVNLRVARHAKYRAIVVGDIDRGGVFASLHGTVQLLPPDLRSLIGGFVINKFRGDGSLLTAGLSELERRSKVPTLGVIPWIEGLGIDGEDSLAIPESRLKGRLDIAVIRLPRMSNFTDLDPLRLEPVSIRWVSHPDQLGHPHLVILPGTKATIADLAWLRSVGLDQCIYALSATTSVLGICGGYQMLGSAICDDLAAESPAPARVAGLGLLPVTTSFETVKTTRRVRATILGQPVDGYEIHHGRTDPPSSWVEAGSVAGTAIHGLFESDGFRRVLLASVARRAGIAWESSDDVSFAAARRSQADRVADAIEQNVDMESVMAMIEGSGR